MEEILLSPQGRMRPSLAGMLICHFFLEIRLERNGRLFRGTWSYGRLLGSIPLCGPWLIKLFITINFVLSFRLESLPCWTVFYMYIYTRTFFDCSPGMLDFL